MNNADMPAMPQPMVMDRYDNITVLSDYDPSAMGLTKREHLAGVIMQGLIARGNRHMCISTSSVALADELLKALEPRNE